MASGFVFLESYYLAIRPLDDELRLKLYDSIFDYVFKGQEPDNLPAILNSLFVLMKPNIDNSIKRYITNCENGKKGGRPKGEKPEQNPTETEQKPKQKPKNNQDKDMEYDKEKEEEKEKESESESIGTPSFEIVSNFFLENGFSSNAELFYNYYQSRGWKISDTPICDWKALAKTWEFRDSNTKQVNNNDEPIEYKEVTDDFYDKW